MSCAFRSGLYPRRPLVKTRSSSAKTPKGTTFIPCQPPVDKRLRPPTDDKMCGDEQGNQTTGCIAKTMGERREQHTSFRVIEDPGVEKRWRQSRR